VGICQDCSTASDDSAEKCIYCGGTVIQQPNSQQVLSQKYYPRKSPVYAFIFTLPLPGFADIYAGNMLKGFIFLIITYPLYSLIPVGQILHAYLVLNSWRVVTKYNNANQRSTSLTLLERKIVYYGAIIGISTIFYFLIEFIFF
jgi:TM2 domain-containing membrane protein YozV